MNDMRSLRALKDEYKTEFVEFLLNSPEFNDMTMTVASDFVRYRVKLCNDVESRVALMRMLRDVIKKGDF